MRARVIISHVFHLVHAETTTTATATATANSSWQTMESLFQIVLGVHHYILSRRRLRRQTLVQRHFCVHQNQLGKITVHQLALSICCARVNHILQARIVNAVRQAKRGCLYLQAQQPRQLRNVEIGKHKRFAYAPMESIVGGKEATHVLLVAGKDHDRRVVLVHRAHQLGDCLVTKVVGSR